MPLTRRLALRVSRSSIYLVLKIGNLVFKQYNVLGFWVVFVQILWTVFECLSQFSDFVCCLIPEENLSSLPSLLNRSGPQSYL